MSKAFEIAKAVTIEICLSSVLLILCVMIIKTSVVDLEEQNPYTLLHSRLLMIASEYLLITLRRLMG